MAFLGVAFGKGFWMVFRGKIKMKFKNMNKTTQQLIEILRKINEINGNLTTQEVETFIFCFLLIVYLEKNIQNALYEALLESQKDELKHPKLIDLLIKEKTFTEKIKVFKFLTEDKTPSWEYMKYFVKYCETINQSIRNNLFHFKLSELKYKGMEVRNIETQNKMIRDLVEIEKKAKKFVSKKTDESKHQKKS